MLYRRFPNFQRKCNHFAVAAFHGYGQQVPGRYQLAEILVKWMLQAFVAYV